MRTAIALFLVVSVAACNKTNEDGLKNDAGINHPVDSGQDMADQGWLPHAYVTIETPQHITTNVDPNTEVTFSVDLHLMDPSTAFGYLKKAITLKTLKGTTQVAGTLVDKLEYKRVHFVPAKPLAADMYYVATVVESKQVQVQKGYGRSVFRVGSLPIVRLVGFVASAAAPTDIDKIVVRFSEGISASTTILGTKVTDTVSKKSIAITASSQTGLNPSMILNLASGHSKSESIDLEIGTDVGTLTKKKLDGLYTGVSGSGPFKKSFIPMNHMKDKVWMPNL